MLKIEQCQGCLNLRSYKCDVITDRSYVWEHGGCWAKKTEPKEMANMYKDMYEYAVENEASQVIIQSLRNKWLMWNGRSKEKIKQEV